jgi:hypothetical protein
MMVEPTWFPVLDDNFGASLELKQIDYVHKQFHKSRVKTEDRSAQSSRRYQQDVRLTHT